MEEQKSFVEYVVRYKSNGVTPNESHSRVKPGIAGKFSAEIGEDGSAEGAHEDALACVERAKKYFNEHRTVKTVTDQDGFSIEPKEVFTTIKKEIAHVWIDTYHDGVRIKNGDPTCKEKQPPVEAKPSTTSTKAASKGGKKSPKQPTKPTTQTGPSTSPTELQVVQVTGSSQ